MDACVSYKRESCVPERKEDMYLGKGFKLYQPEYAKFKQIYIRYAASIFCAFIIAVVSIIDKSEKKGFDIESIVTVCSIWLAGNFLVESLWKKTAEEAQKNKQKWLIGYGVTFVIAIVFENLSEILKAQKADIPNLIFESILYFYYCMHGASCNLCIAPAAETGSATLYRTDYIRIAPGSWCLSGVKYCGYPDS